MSSSLHTNNTRRYRTIILIIGVVVAIMIGYSVSASPEVTPDFTVSDDSTQVGLSWLLAGTENSFSLLVKLLKAI